MICAKEFADILMTPLFFNPKLIIGGKPTKGKIFRSLMKTKRADGRLIKSNVVIRFPLRMTKATAQRYYLRILGNISAFVEHFRSTDFDVVATDLIFDPVMDNRLRDKIQIIVRLFNNRTPQTP